VRLHGAWLRRLSFGIFRFPCYALVLIRAYILQAWVGSVDVHNWPRLVTGAFCSLVPVLARMFHVALAAPIPIWPLCKKHKATLVIARLDRLARNLHFISGLMEAKVTFVACDMPEATPFMALRTDALSRTTPKALVIAAAYWRSARIRSGSKEASAAAGPVRSLPENHAECTDDLFAPSSARHTLTRSRRCCSAS
jgi:hypothetical protein